MRLDNTLVSTVCEIGIIGGTSFGVSAAASAFGKTALQKTALGSIAGSIPNLFFLYNKRSQFSADSKEAIAANTDFRYGLVETTLGVGISLLFPERIILSVILNSLISGIVETDRQMHGHDLNLKQAFISGTIAASTSLIIGGTLTAIGHGLSKAIQINQADDMKESDSVISLLALEERAKKGDKTSAAQLIRHYASLSDDELHLENLKGDEPPIALQEFHRRDKLLDDLLEKAIAEDPVAKATLLEKYKQMSTQTLVFRTGCIEAERRFELDEDYFAREVLEERCSRMSTLELKAAYQIDSTDIASREIYRRVIKTLADITDEQPVDLIPSYKLEELAQLPGTWKFWILDDQISSINAINFNNICDLEYKYVGTKKYYTAKQALHSRTGTYYVASNLIFGPTAPEIQVKELLDACDAPIKLGELSLPIEAYFSSPEYQRLLKKICARYPHLRPHEYQNPFLHFY